MIAMAGVISNEGAFCTRLGYSEGEIRKWVFKIIKFELILQKKRIKTRIVHLSKGFFSRLVKCRENLILIHEVDFRIGWIQELFLGLKHAFVNVDENLKTIEYYDGIFAKEQTETILGVAFITAQTYITGTISDISAIRKVPRT